VSPAERTAARLAELLPRECLGRLPARAGWPELPLAAPRELEQWVEVVRYAARERLVLLPVGQGSKLAWRGAPARADLAIATTNWSGVTAFEPGDGTLTARAGTSLAELAETVRATHHLSPEVALPAGTSLGGTLAAGASGLDRLRHGPVRHQVLGLGALLADGSCVKSGGRVVKNVTGYDLHRLWIGSQGTLCLLLEATLRLQPAPASEAVLVVPCASRADALERARALGRTGAQPVAVLAHDRAPDRTWRLAVVLAGREEVVAFELEEARRVLGAHERHEGDGARALRAELRDLERAGGRWSALFLGGRPSGLAAELARLDELALRTGLAFTHLVHPLLASIALWIEGERQAELDAGLRAARFQVRWRERPAELAPAPPPDSPEHALARRLRDAFDPQGLFAPLGTPHVGP